MDRRSEILKAIIKHFTETAEPVGSNTLIMSYHFEVSPATIRNDMASLENEGLLSHPHTSSGRIPTDLGYRTYVDEMADYDEARTEALATLKELRTMHEQRKARRTVYDAVSLLADATANVCFATVPDNPRTFYLGVSNVLRQPEFSSDSERASKVIEVLEKGDTFRRTLDELEIGDDVRIFIGKENILNQIQSCSIVISRYIVEDYQGYMGILGPTRMRYPFHVALLKEIKKLFSL